MLGLKLPTDPRWVDLAAMQLDDILTDHAYCEQKAASSGITLIQGYPDYVKLVENIAPLVTEEWGHFRMVLAEIRKRGYQLGNQRKDLYVSQLYSFQMNGGSREERLLDKLLTFALVEARSCERFRLLSLELEDENLREFYHKFMVSEAGHYRMFIDLANEYFNANMVKKRWEEYLVEELRILNNLNLRGDRIH
ncbi:MAG: tRNA-(ms[2]io[6]A)-hydroxylase [Saprospiraceae bacterium]